MQFVLNVASLYEQTTKSLDDASKKVQPKVYKSMNTMLEECYFVGASKFGHNFIA